MSATYDEWKSTEPEDPFADELELERREEEMGEDEPDYSVIDTETPDWSELNDEADNINIITGEVEPK